MKYIIVLGDGMSDYKDSEGLTPLMRADKPCIDFLAGRSKLGLVKTVPEGMKPGSDNANLSVMGYDPLLYYTGRSPLEALSMGIKLGETDLTYRCNLVTLSDGGEYADKMMVDYSSDEITTTEAAALIDALNKELPLEQNALRLYSGVSYRHCLVSSLKEGMFMTAPHDITDKKIAGYLPKGENAELLLALQIQSYEILSRHEVNINRISRGLRPANSIWLWGEGKKPALPAFKDKFGHTGAVISAVDLIKGIGLCAGLRVYEVPGATGNILTNFEGKADAALNALLNDGLDFVYVHVEAPDECGHRGEHDNKVKSIEYLDKRLVKRLYDGLVNAGEDFNMLILPDHATPLSLKSHTSDSVPFLLYKSASPVAGGMSYNEDTCAATGVFVEKGHALIELLFGRD